MIGKSGPDISIDTYMSAQQLAEQLSQATQLLEELSEAVLLGGFEQAKQAVRDSVEYGRSLFESINYVYQEILKGNIK